MRWLKNLWRWLFGDESKPDFQLSYHELAEMSTRSLPSNPDVLSTPQLDKLLAIVRSEVIRQATQDGGPDLHPSLELVIDCKDDELLRRVLGVKGGSFSIVVRLLPDLDGGVKLDFAEELSRVRAVNGVTTNAEQLHVN